MIDSVPGQCRARLRSAAVLVLTAALLVACSVQPAEPPEDAEIADFLTLQPDMVLTLTAWPTPPPLITQAPTSTVAPQTLWSIEEVTPQEDVATATSALPTATPPGPATQGAAQARPAPVGSNPPPVRLLVPAVGLDVPVQQVSWYPTSQDGTWRSTWETAEGAVGHHRNSANPGEAGNVVLSGHHNAYGEVFRDVSEIGLPGSPMDEGSALILVAQDGRQHTYSVLRWERFQVEGIPDAERGAYARYMAPSTDPILTVITCWPYDGNSHRVVVVAEFQATQ